MAGVMAAVDPSLSVAEVIDLTRSDSEDDSTKLTLSSRPLFKNPAAEPREHAGAAHGLLLNRDFGSFNRWGSSRGVRFSNTRFLNGGTSQPRRHITTRPSKGGTTQPHRYYSPKFSNGGTSQLRQHMTYKTRRIGKRSIIRPRVRQLQDSPANIIKRLRATLGIGKDNDDNDGDEQISKIEQDHKTPEIHIATEESNVNIPSCGSQFNAARAFQISPKNRRGSEISNDVMNESLRIALRQQVFPHVNRRLTNYRLSIDNGTRRQLGKKVILLSPDPSSRNVEEATLTIKQAAWEICGEDFMNDLMQNDGCLSVAYEAKVAALACSLIDQYAAKFVSTTGKEEDKNNIFENESMLKGSYKKEKQEHSQSRTRTVVTSAEVAGASRNTRLSVLMKDRRARGEMDSIIAKRAAMTMLKKVARTISRPSQRFSRHNEGHTFAERTLSLRSLGSRVSSYGHDIHRPAAQLTVKLRIDEPLRTLSIPQHIPPALTQKQPILQLGGKSQFPENSIWLSAVEKTKPGTVVKHPPKPRIIRRDGVAPRCQKTVSISQSAVICTQLENMRLAGLDEHLSRPYLTWQSLKDIEKGLAVILNKRTCPPEQQEEKLHTLRGLVLHVDFSHDEIEHIIPVIESVMGRKVSWGSITPKERIEYLMIKREKMIPKVVAALISAQKVTGSRLCKTRASTALTAFLQDAAARTLSSQPGIRRIELCSMPAKKVVKPSDSIKSALLQREVYGRRRNPRASRSIKDRVLNAIEDDFVRQAEWTDCAGDIATVEWIDCERFFCGATTHSDEHNMQYNKPGNLLVGASVEKTLKSVPGHQIVRPIVATGENSLEAMRGTQDPWMYCSVTSTAYSHDNRKCFTGSYDQTVKVWDIAQDGSAMTLCGIWSHAGNVNFVAASPSHGLVATAADVREDAVRVYHFDPSNITASAFDIYEASVQRHNSSDNWAYFPSTMRWGISSSVSHLLLVGYSPRSFSCHDEDIPDDKINSGELCLWNSIDGNLISITSARTQNVFEVVWHPTQPIFVAATSPAGLFEDWVKTQLRVFQQTACGSFSHVKTLDCPALDINEITIMPNSIVNSYITASCTDSKTYIWDSALSDKPLHILRHGDSIDEHVHDEAEQNFDIGVKFAAWGKNIDRFYTGSSDGVVKVWNIRAPPGLEFVRNMVKLSGGISAGKFSPNFGNLIIGDSTGKVHLFSLEKLECSENIVIAKRQPISPHAPLPAPLIDDDDMEIPPEQTATEIAEEFLRRGQIVIHGDEWVGAVQGPNYATTGLFYVAEKHKDESACWSQEEMNKNRRQRYNIDRIQCPQLGNIQSSSWLLHEKNGQLDLNLSALLPNVNAFLESGMDFEFESDSNFFFELGPKLAFKEVEETSLTENEPLSNHEVQELKVLKEQICNRMHIQKSLKDLIKSL